MSDGHSGLASANAGQPGRGTANSKRWSLGTQLRNVKPDSDGEFTIASY